MLLLSEIYETMDTGAVELPEFPLGITKRQKNKYFNGSLKEVMKDGEIPFIWVDMDGVLADFEKAINKLLKDNDLPNISDVSYWKGKKDKLWELTAEKGDFWENLDFISTGKRLWDTLSNKYNTGILTKSTHTDPTCSEGKKKWIAKNLKNVKKVVIIKQGTSKGNFSIVEELPAILIDDWEKNIKEFKEKGGVAIHHHKYKLEQTFATLRKIGFRI